jgi:hypothetical protein
MKKINLKSAAKALLVLLLVVGVAGGAGFIGFNIGENQTSTTTEEGAAGAARKYLEIVEDENGDISIKGQDFDEAVGIDNTRLFLEQIPTTCSTAIVEARKIMGTAEHLEKLGVEPRANLSLILTVARDLCSYEEYRNFLAGELGDFIFTDPEQAGESTATTDGATTETSTETAETSGSTGK